MMLMIVIEYDLVYIMVRENFGDLYIVMVVVEY